MFADKATITNVFKLISLKRCILDFQELKYENKFYVKKILPLGNVKI